MLALNEFTDLKKKLEIEEANRKTAEDVATEVYLHVPCNLSICFFLCRINNLLCVAPNYLRARDTPKNQISNFASKPCSKYPL